MPQIKPPGLCLTTLTATLLVTFFATSSPAADSPTRPTNIVIILADDK